jgi:hypothetical protein
MEQRLGCLAIATDVPDPCGPAGDEKAQEEARWQRVEALAVRLGVEPLAGDDYSGVAIYDPEGEGGYAVAALVQALLSRIEVAERLLAEQEPSNDAVAGLPGGAWDAEPTSGPFRLIIGAGGRLRSNSGRRSGTSTRKRRDDGEPD